MESAFEQNIGHDVAAGRSDFQSLLSLLQKDSDLNAPAPSLHTEVITSIASGSDLFSVLNGRGSRRRLQAPEDSSSSSNSSTVPLTVKVVETVAGADWRASGGNLQPKALGPLQQLLDDLIKLGVTAVLPGFSSSLVRFAGLTVDEAGGW
jgi:hypothetical protein